MPKKPDPIKYDPVIGRYRATCATCGYVAVRAKRDAAEWMLAQHTAYTHEGESRGEA